MIEARRLCGALSLVLLLEVVVAHVGGEPNSDNESVRGQAGASGIGLAAALVRVGDLALGALLTRLKVTHVSY